MYPPAERVGVVNCATSIGSKSLFGDSAYASVAIGAVALLTSILNTVGSYFAWARRAESHKQSSLQYAKLYRFLSIEMSLPRHERMRPGDLLKYVHHEYDRFAETSPLVPPSVVELFKSRFSGEQYRDIAVPEEMNGLTAIAVPNSAPPHFERRIRRPSFDVSLHSILRSAPKKVDSPSAPCCWEYDNEDENDDNDTHLLRRYQRQVLGRAEQ